MEGYDELLGSHFDSYTITYYSYDGNVTMPENAFVPPSGMKCGDFPGPGNGGHGRGALLMLEDFERDEKVQRRPPSCRHLAPG